MCQGMCNDVLNVLWKQEGKLQSILINPSPRLFQIVITLLAFLTSLIIWCNFCNKLDCSALNVAILILISAMSGKLFVELFVSI